MRILLFALFFLSVFSPVGAQEPGEPFEIMRQIVNAQDQLLTGRPEAVSETKRLDAAFMATARAATQETWRSPRNRRALALYLLAGGEAAAAIEARANWPEQNEENNLYDGALAFAQGREKEALNLLAPLDPKLLPADVSGQVALAQGVLWMDRDPKKSMTALDLARLLAPGALVEESALRRQVFLAGGGEDCTRFVALSERYRLRFANTAFAENFETGFRNGFLRFWSKGGINAQSVLENFLQDLSKEERVALLLSAVRAGLSDGELQPASMAAQALQTALGPQDPRQAQATIYASAARVFDDPFDDAKLIATPSEKLSREDQILRAAILVTNAARKNSFETATPQPDEESEIMIRAKAVIGAANAILRGAEK